MSEIVKENLGVQVIKGYGKIVDLISNTTRKVTEQILFRKLQRLGIESDWSQVMQHISFIMDGNRTEERLRFLRTRTKLMAQLLQIEDTYGHYQGFLIAKKIMEICARMKMPYASFWALSDDNVLKRSKEEVTLLFRLLVKALPDITQLALKNNIRIRIIGNRTLLPDDCVIAINNAELLTKDNTGTTAIIGIGYGGIDEVIRAIHDMAKDGKDMETVGKEDLLAALETGKDMPPPDCIIRTGGQKRISGWLLAVGVHAEYFFSKRNWPRFDTAELYKVILDYMKRVRKFGK